METTTHATHLPPVVSEILAFVLLALIVVLLINRSRKKKGKPSLSADQSQQKEERQAVSLLALRQEVRLQLRIRQPASLVWQLSETDLC